MATAILEQFANPLTKALLAGNSQAAEWENGQPLSLIRPLPSVGNTDGTLPDGMWALPQGGFNTQAQRLWLQPFAQGGPALTFAMRLFGWRFHGATHLDGRFQLNVPFFIAEFLCTTCNMPGPVAEGPGGTPSVRPLGPDEYLCDTITLVQGDLGASGWINATGATNSPTSLPGYIEVELHGASRYYFDFKQVDPVAMNCFWSKL